MPPGEVTTAEAAEADPAAATLSTAELKRTARAVAVEMLRVRTVFYPHEKNPVDDRELKAPRSTRT